MKVLAIMTAAAIAAAASAQAEDDIGGELNPSEMGLSRVLENAATGDLDMMTCASGYFLTKSGAHAPARKVFKACAEAGWTGAMSWMSWMDDNGLAGPEDAEAAAAWDRRAAEAGDHVGMFNYGLDLMRGRGVAQDDAAGRRWIDDAALRGLPAAIRLQDAGYDLDEVTPDADNWKYEKRLY